MTGDTLINGGLYTDRRHVLLWLEHFGQFTPINSAPPYVNQQPLRLISLPVGSTEDFLSVHPDSHSRKKVA
jgi:hypothetical protein